MNTCPIEPSIGDKISASWMRELVRYVRSITPMPGKNTRTRRTPTGTFIDALPGGKGGDGERNPLFAIGATDNPDAGEPVEGGEEGETEPDKVKGIVNCYFMRGGILDKVDDFIWDKENWKNGFLAFQIWTSIEDVPTHEDDEGKKVNDYPKIEIFEDLVALNIAQSNSNLYTYPLYKLNEDGGVELDLRSVINIQLFEPVIRPSRPAAK